MHVSQNNTIRLLMLTEQFECYLNARWKANFDCCLDGNFNSIWQCLSTLAQSRCLFFLLMFLKYVAFPEGDWITKKLPWHGHQHEATGCWALRLCSCFRGHPLWLRPTNNWSAECTNKLNKRANPDTVFTETVTTIASICGCPQNGMTNYKLQSKLPTVV